MEKLEPDIQLKFLDVAALQAMFGVGRSKARLMMDALPSIRVSNKDYVSQKALTDYLTVNGGIPISWPKRRR